MATNGIRPILSRLRKPRCILLYALAPAGMGPAEANRLFNSLIADEQLPLPVYHDHFIGEPGGLAIFYVETEAQHEVLSHVPHLEGWRVEVRPLVFASSPAAFDEQISFTLRAYRGADWEQLQVEARPSFGSPSREAATAEEDFE